MKNKKINFLQIASVLVVLVIVACEPKLSSIERVVPFNFILAFAFYLIAFVQIRLYEQSVGLTTFVAGAITISLMWSGYQGHYFVLWYLPILAVAASVGYFVIGKESADRIAQTA